MSSAIQNALDRRSNMSPHSPARLKKDQTLSSPTFKHNPKKARARLTSDSVQKLSTVIQHIFARALIVQPVDPIAYVADQIRLAHAHADSTAAEVGPPSSSSTTTRLPPVRPTGVPSNNRKSNPRFR
jgi:hypothetical protein